MDTEGQLIRRIANRVPSRPKRLLPRGLKIGIGDDAAVVSARRGMELVATCDSFLEGVHFLGDIHPPDSVGFKSLARATSDIAAMGGRPRWFLLALALPPKRTGSWLTHFSAGMGRAARSLGLTLIGGDTTKSSSISITVTVLGEIHPGRAVARSSARPGDLIYVSGKLGEAQLGLEWVRRGLPISRRFQSLLQPHLYPRIPVALGGWLAGRRIPSAMMDISDGLSTDLARLCALSGVGATIEAARIPRAALPQPLPPPLRRARLDPLAMALHGGDDYALLFTVPRRKVPAISRFAGFRSLACIGRITRERKIVLVDAAGNRTPLASRGWDPFGSR
ncbi:MAG TPA: thiamine-phosphate kinase [Verrucomicrobiae bacterium]|nr:thiamine-phosphate kinase [Verrucomicrobiae bacterium]